MIHHCRQSKYIQKFILWSQSIIADVKSKFIVALEQLYKHKYSFDH